MLVKNNLGAQIYQQLRQELMAGRYEPGQKLKLRELADRLGVSVTPVREALARLVVDQALEQVDHRSVRVAIMDLARFHEVRELRLDLEGLGAENAALRASAADIRELRAIHVRLTTARAQNSYRGILQENESFHLTLCRVAGMPVLLRLVEALWLQCGPLMHGTTSWPTPRPRQHPHVGVIKALQAGDGAMARAAIQQDITMSTDALLGYLTSHKEQPGWARRSLLTRRDAPGDRAPERKPD